MRYDTYRLPLILKWRRLIRTANGYVEYKFTQHAVRRAATEYDMPLNMCWGGGVVAVLMFQMLRLTFGDRCGLDAMCVRLVGNPTECAMGEGAVLLFQGLRLTLGDRSGLRAMGVRLVCVVEFAPCAERKVVLLLGFVYSWVALAKSSRAVPRCTSARECKRN